MPACARADQLLLPATAPASEGRARCPQSAGSRRLTASLSTALHAGGAVGTPHPSTGLVPILVPGAPVLFSCMKRVNPMAYMAASAALAAAVLAGCARAHSQTSVTNTDRKSTRLNSSHLGISY